MRTKEDNILKIAEFYERDLMKTGAYEEFDESELQEIFSCLMRDYRKVVKRATEEGIDAEDTESKAYRNEFKTSPFAEKEEIIERVKNRIASLVEACSVPPKDIEDKYSREKDVVSMMEDGCVDIEY